GIEPGSVGKPGVDHWRSLVDAPAYPRDNAVDDLEEVFTVAEYDLRLGDLPLLLDVNVTRTVDHDVADPVVLEQQLERAESEGFVEHLVDQALALVAIQEGVLGVAELLDDAADLAAQRFGIDLGDAIHVEPVDQARVDQALERLVFRESRVNFARRLIPA